jgi:UDP-glucose 4-epimerase
MSERGRKKVIVTGSSGMIGTAVCEKLFSADYSVIPVDWKANAWNGFVNKKTVLTDLRDISEVYKIPHDADVIIHLAGNSSVLPILKEPSLANDNFIMVFNMLEFARKNKIPRFIFASSREVYGNGKKESYAEGDVDIDCCGNPYAAAKIGGEAFVKAYEKCFELNTVILRFSNVYGKYDDSERVIPSFIRKTLKDEPVKIFGEKKVLDFIFIDDVVTAVMNCLEKFDIVKGNIFNIASGRGITLIELAHLIRRISNGKNSISIEGNRTGETSRFVGDITRTEKVLEFAPLISIDEGLLRTIEWHKSRSSL